MLPRSITLHNNRGYSLQRVVRNKEIKFSLLDSRFCLSDHSDFLTNLIPNLSATNGINEELAESASNDDSPQNHAPQSSTSNSTPASSDVSPDSITDELTNILDPVISEKMYKIF